MGSLYVIHGDELLLGLEAADLIRRAAKYKGFEDRIVLVAENRFDWSKLKEQSQSVSLFSTNKVVDLRIPTGKPGKSGSDALQAYVKNIPENIVDKMIDESVNYLWSRTGKRNIQKILMHAYNLASSSVM